MLKKNYAIILAVFIAGINVSAQSIDQVTLKNGSIIRGNILKIVPEGNVTINDRSGNTWVYSMTDVAKIEETEMDSPIADQGFEKGWVSMSSIGFLIGSQSSSFIAPFSIQTSFGYRNSLGIYTGLLTGLEFINVTHLPMMLDLQYSLKPGPVNPVLIARAGYTFPTQRKEEYYSTDFTYTGGPVMAIGVGLKVRNKDILAWDVSVLYRYMQINYTEEYNWDIYSNRNTYKDIYNRLELRFGFYLGR